MHVCSRLLPIMDVIVLAVPAAQKGIPAASPTQTAEALSKVRCLEHVPSPLRIAKFLFGCGIYMKNYSFFHFFFFRLVEMREFFFPGLIFRNFVIDFFFFLTYGVLQSYFKFSPIIPT